MQSKIKSISEVLRQTDLTALPTSDFLAGMHEAVNGSEPKFTADDFEEFYNTHSFNEQRRPPEDVGILYYKGMRIGSTGNILTITGKAKSRKTVIASAIASSFYLKPGEEFLGFHSELKPSDGVLHIDTEQAYQHYYESVVRIFRDAGAKRIASFKSVHTRGADTEFLIAFIEYMLEVHNPRVLIIDGVGDLIDDLLNHKEAKALTSRLLRWAQPVPGQQEKDRLIVAIIHTTKSTGYMTGAIGTYLEKKAETVIKVEKPDDNEMISNISCQYSRDKPFPSFSIEYDEKAQRYTVIPESEISTKGNGGDVSPAGYPQSVHDAVVARVFNYRSSLTKFELSKSIQKSVEVITKDKLKAKDINKWIDYYNVRAVIAADPDGNWMRVEPVISTSQTALPFLENKEEETAPVGDYGKTISSSSDDDLPF